MDDISFALEFMEKEAFPPEAVAALTETLQRLAADEAALFAMRKAVGDYLFIKTRYKDARDAVRRVGKDLALTPERSDFVFFLLCLYHTKKIYEGSNLSDELFYDTFADLKYKLLECKSVRNEWGTFVPSWYDGFFRLTRFTLGRFQFEVKHFPFFRYKKHGVRLRHGCPVINFHIPSSGQPLTAEARLDSYKRAYDFYKDTFPDGKAVFFCFSWLLYRKHFDFLPGKLNILDFMRDFEILHSVTMPVFPDKWRVFGADATKKAADLPEGTSLQRAYKERLQRNPFASGYGCGVIVFDGERILTRTPSGE